MASSAQTSASSTIAKRRSWRRASAGICAARLMPHFASAERNARIDQRADEIDREIDQREQQDGEQQIGDDDRPIAGLDRFDDQLADAGPGEHRLGDHAEGEQHAEDDAKHRDRAGSRCSAARSGTGSVPATAPWRGRSECRFALTFSCTPARVRRIISAMRKEGEIERRQRDMAPAPQGEQARLDAEDRGGRPAPAGREHAVAGSTAA